MAGKTALTASASDNDAWTAPQDGMSSLFIRLSPGGAMGGGVPAIESGPSSRITAIAAVQYPRRLGNSRAVPAPRSKPVRALPAPTASMTARYYYLVRSACIVRRPVRLLRRTLIIRSNPPCNGIS